MSSSPYQEAGNLLQEVIVNRRGLKSVAFSGNNKKKKCSKTAYAQACKTLRHKALLDQILNLNDRKLYRAVKVKDTKNQGLLYVLLFELLFGLNQKIRGGGALKRNICKQEKQLRDAKEIVVDNSDNDMDNAMVVFPRYIRINTLKETSNNVIKKIQQTLKNENNDGDADTTTDSDEQAIYRDKHVPNLLVLSPNNKIPWYKHQLVTNGNVVLQDKSSCFSALALVYGSGNGSNAFLENGCDFIDACAAPGNKTTHLAALVALARAKNNDTNTSGKGKKKTKKKTNDNQTLSKIFALDKSSSRIKILQERVSELVPASSNITNVEVQPLHEDFLKVASDDPSYKDVKAILLDPSCSGSGIVNSIDRFYLDQQQKQSNDNKKKDSGDDNDETTPQKSRVEAIASFQRLALLHAMSFPNLKRIVYSTCSIHDEENEIVVGSALCEHNEKHGENENEKWKIVAPMALNGWTRRGYKDVNMSEDIPWTEEDAKACIRVDGVKGDETNGFFVCCFERLTNNDDDMTNKGLENPLIHESTEVNKLIPLYNSEFRNLMAPKTKEVQNQKIKKSEKVSNDSTETQKSKPNKIGKAQIAKAKARENKKNGKKAPPDAATKNSSSKVEDKIVKKKAKKLAWKIRQKEQKMMRLLKKEAEKD